MALSSLCLMIAVCSARLSFCVISSKLGIYIVLILLDKYTHTRLPVRNSSCIVPHPERSLLSGIHAAVLPLFPAQPDAAVPNSAEDFHPVQDEVKSVINTLQCESAIMGSLQNVKDLYSIGKHIHTRLPIRNSTRFVPYPERSPLPVFLCSSASTISCPA